MRDGQASVTAMGIALMRAHETGRPAAERVLEDPFARHFAPAPMRWLFAGVRHLSRAGVNLMIARERFGDEVLQRELARGLEQVVLLGAGYDARAYRFKDALEGVGVFEVDHPATQARKQRELVSLMGALPPHVTFVPIDFKRQTLAERLASSGFHSGAKTLFIWQGVTPYLDDAAVDHTLAYITRHAAPGSTLVFDYVIRRFMKGPLQRREFRLLSVFRPLSGERLQWGLEVDEVVPFLERRGFTDIENLTHEALHARYFQGAAARREVYDVVGLVAARVAAPS